MIFWTLWIVNVHYIDATIGKLYCSGWSRSWEWRKLIVCWNLIIKPDTVVIGEFENFKVFIRKPPKLNQSYFANRENLIRCIKHNGPFLHFLFLYFSNFVRASKNTKINWYKLYIVQEYYLILEALQWMCKCCLFMDILGYLQI